MAARDGAAGKWPEASGLVSARLSVVPVDNLILLDRAVSQLHVLGADSVNGRSKDSATESTPSRLRFSETLKTDAAATAVLPMSLNADALSDLVVLRNGSADPAIIMSAAGGLAPEHTIFSNTSPIPLPRGGPITPFPSTIVVSGEPSVSRVRVRINDLSESYPPNLDLLLVGPQGQKVLFLSDAGGPQTVNNATVIFDDAAGSFVVPFEFRSGTYKPTNVNDGSNDVFDSPAPPGPYAATLSAFNGSDPNGTWSLYIVEDSGVGFGGNIAGGWSLIFGEDSPRPPLIVTNINDVGVGSLRQAILDSNANIGADVINFNIPSGPLTITPSSSLPTITEAVLIDGTSQPGFGGQPIIEINGSTAGGVGLFLTGGNSRIRGLVINRFTDEGILIRVGGNNVIEGNFIGTSLNGAAAQGNDDGIGIDNANNLIGGTTPAARNVISGNRFNAIFFETFDADLATGNVIQGNYIGTNVAGSGLVANGSSGVSTNSAPGSTGQHDRRHCGWREKCHCGWLAPRGYRLSGFIGIRGPG